MSDQFDLSALVIGAIAGWAGEGALMAARSFDEKYAPRTVAPTGQAVLKRAALQRTAGPVLGVLYALWRGRALKNPSPFDGLLLGLAGFAVEAMSSMAGRRSDAPLFKQDFPQLAGQMLRHTVYGMVAVTIYGILRSKSSTKE